MPKILIIDDDAELIDSVKMILDENGYAVISAQNGLKGMEKAKKDHPDLIILDVMMTNDSEGFEVARKLKEESSTSKIPVILLTGIKKAKGLPFSFEPDEDWLPVKAVLEKPVKPEILLKSIKSAIG